MAGGREDRAAVDDVWGRSIAVPIPSMALAGSHQTKEPADPVSASAAACSHNLTPSAPATQSVR